ncbi:MAG: hypothetical protein JWN92_2610 [Candidatus Acidoferrum typicum]|nr:hypothetical protein [Candidatus Acidoferrum typicum]
MLNDPPPETHTGFSKYLIFSGVALLLAGLYVGWVFLNRWQANQALEQKAASERRSQDRQTFEMMGGNRFDILRFYADPGSIRAGETAELCYSVSNAKSVKLDPPAEPVWPAFSRCVHVSPRKTTTYTFTAEDATGQTKSAAVKVEVR